MNEAYVVCSFTIKEQVQLKLQIHWHDIRIEKLSISQDKNNPLQSLD